MIKPPSIAAKPQSTSLLIVIPSETVIQPKSINFDSNSKLPPAFIGMKHLLKSGLSGALLVLSAMVPIDIQAQPTVTVEAHQINNFHYVLFTFTQNDLPSMEGCHYNLLSADKRKALLSLPGRRLISVATFYKPLSVVQIIAGPLKHVSRLIGPNHRDFERTVKVYFRTLLSCPQATNGMGNIFSVTFKTFVDGTLGSIKELRNAMKYHMKYYQP
jgi:hypothetical protein